MHWGPHPLPTQGEECGRGCREGRGGSRRRVAWRPPPPSIPQAWHQVAASRTRPPSPVPDALRPPPRAAGICVKGRLFSCCCMTPRPPERPSAGPLPVEAWARTPAALSGTVGAAQRPWPVAPSTPPAAAAQLCPVSWGTVLNSSEMRGFWSCPQVVSSRGLGLSVLNTAGAGPTLGPMMVSHAWPPAHSHWREVMAGGEALLGIRGLRAPPPPA